MQYHRELLEFLEELATGCLDHQFVWCCIERPTGRLMQRVTWSRSSIFSFAAIGEGIVDHHG